MGYALIGRNEHLMTRCKGLGATTTSFTSTTTTPTTTGRKRLGIVTPVAAGGAVSTAKKVVGKIKGLFGGKKKKKKAKPAAPGAVPAVGRAATMEVSLDKVVMYGGIGLMLLLSAYVIVRASRD